MAKRAKIPDNVPRPRTRAIGHVTKRVDGKHVDGTFVSECGLTNPSYTPFFREHVTCLKCRRSEAFKRLPTYPRKHRKGRKK